MNGASSRITAMLAPLAGGVFLVVATAASAQPGSGTPLAQGRNVLAVQGQRYGTLADDDPVTQRVREVFTRVVRAAGQRPGLALEVHVLDTMRVIAESLRGGLVMVSRGFVDLTKNDDHALAFILAHEVAHLVRDHHTILENLGVLGASSSGPAVPPNADLAVRTYRGLEIDADRLGVLFAALAGYRATAAVPILVALTERSGPDLFHPNPVERAAAIASTITEIADHVQVFHLGLFLLGSGRYLDAARVLEHFLVLFPSREVLSAVGVAYHKEALRYAPPAPFRHLLVIDAVTRAPATKGAGVHPSFRALLERALYYYRLAVDADPGYAPARNNLGVAHLDLGDLSLALGHLTRAINDDPSLVAAYNDRAVVLAALRDPRAAETDWLVAARLAPGVREIAQNLAQFYASQGRGDEAARWTSRANPAEPADGAPPGGERLPALAAGSSVTAVREWMSEPGVRTIAVPLGPGQQDLSLVVLGRRGLAMAVQNGVIEAIGLLPTATAATARGLRPGDPVARVQALYGRPPTTDGVQFLNVLGYPSRSLTVFAVRDRVQAVWFGRPPGER